MDPVEQHLTSLQWYENNSNKHDMIVKRENTQSSQKDRKLTHTETCQSCSHFTHSPVHAKQDRWIDGFEILNVSDFSCKEYLNKTDFLSPLPFSWREISDAWSQLFIPLTHFLDSVLILLCV